ncbi:uncharacterized protein LOC111130887 [Crassostrea virginica]
MRNMALVLDKRIFHALNNYLCEEKKFLFGVLKVKSCNATLSVPFSKAECKYDGYWDDTYGISEMCAISFQTIFDKGVSLLKMIENAGEDGWTDEIDDHTKSALIRLNEYIENKDRHVKSLLTVLNMDDASETDISVVFGEHLLGLLAPSKTYRVDGRSKGKQCCRCGCDAFPAFNNTGIGHEEVWHGYIDLVLPSYPSYEDMQSIAKIVVQMDEEKQSKKRKLDFDGEEKKTSREKSIVTVKQVLPEKEYEQALAQTIVFSLLQKKEHPALKHHMIPNIVISPKEVEVLLYDAENDILLCGNRFRLFVEKNSERVTLFDYSIVFLWMVLNYKIFCSFSKTETLKRYKSNFPIFAAGKWEVYENNLKSNVAHFNAVENSPNVQFFLQTSVKLLK